MIRRWTIIQLEKHKGQGEFIQCYLRSELAVTLRAAECYADNYTAWSHREWLVERFMHDKRKVCYVRPFLDNATTNLICSLFSTLVAFFFKETLLRTSSHENVGREAHIRQLWLSLSTVSP